jgi:hypothetical protein
VVEPTEHPPCGPPVKPLRGYYARKIATALPVTAALATRGCPQSVEGGVLAELSATTPRQTSRSNWHHLAGWPTPLQVPSSPMASKARGQRAVAG